MITAAIPPNTIQRFLESEDDHNSLMVESLCGIVRFLGFEDADEFAENDGVGQRASFQINVGEEVIVERLQELGDFFLVPAGVLQQDTVPETVPLAR